MFHGLLRRQEAEMPTSTPLQVQKQRQIENLRTMLPNVTEVVKDVDYRVPVSVGDVNITLIVLLPPHFPQDKPVIHITPCVTHPWVNEQQQITGCSSLRQFSMHSDLGKVINDIIEEFRKRSPVLDSANPSINTAELRYSLMPHDPSMLAGNPIDTSSAPSLSASLSFLAMICSSLNLTDVPAFYPTLKDLSLEQLQILNEDEHKLADYVDDLPIFKVVESHLTTLASSNEDLARKNLERQPEIEKFKKDIIEQASNISDLRKRFDENTVKFMHGVEKFSPMTIQNVLRTYTVKAEEESEKFAQDFLDEQVRVEMFLPIFMEKRQLYHLRKAKEEKLSQQLIQLKHDIHRTRIPPCTAANPDIAADLN